MIVMGRREVAGLIGEGSGVRRGRRLLNGVGDLDYWEEQEVRGRK